VWYRGKRLSLYTSQVAHLPGAYPGFHSMKRQGVFPLPLDGMPVHRRVTPSIKFTGTNLYTWVETGTVSVKCLAQEHNTILCPQPGPRPGLLDLETSALTTLEQGANEITVYEEVCGS